MGGLVPVHPVAGEAVHTRRRLGAGMAAVGAGPLLGLVAACGGAGEGGTAPPAAGPVTVTYLSHLGETHPEGKGYLDLLAEFNRSNQEKITVALEEGRPATGYDKMLALAAAGTPADVARIDSTRSASLFVPGATTDMEAVLKRDKDWARQKADMFPGHLENQVWGGKLMSIASYQAVQGMVYSPKLLNRAGVPLPKAGWTWTDFKEAAQKASKPPETWGLSFAWIMHHLLSWVGTTGAAYVAADKRKMTVNTPEVQEAAEFVLGLIRGNLTAAAPNTELFRKGTDEAVFEQNGPFRMPTYRQNGITDFGVIHHPVHPQKKVVAGYADGSEIVVFKGPPPARQAAAGRVALYLNGPYAQAQQCIRVTMVPVSKAAANAKELQDHLKTDAQHKAFVDVAFQGRSARFPSLPSYQKIVNETITPGVADILAQKVSVRDGLADVQQRTQVLLDEDLKSIS
jgi:multiple sugar transport system substrate-binding protein